MSRVEDNLCCPQEFYKAAFRNGRALPFQELIIEQRTAPPPDPCGVLR